VRPNTLRGQLGHVRHHNERSDEVTSIACLGLLDTLGPEDNLQRARDTAPGQLGLNLLDSDLLEVDELRVVQVQLEALPIRALRVLARRWLRVFELLLDVLDHGGAVQADKSAADELRVNRVRSGHLGRDAHESADLG